MALEAYHIERRNSKVWNGNDARHPLFTTRTHIFILTTHNAMWTKKPVCFSKIDFSRRIRVDRNCTRAHIQRYSANSVLFSVFFTLFIIIYAVVRLSHIKMDDDADGDNEIIFNTCRLVVLGIAALPQSFSIFFFSIHVSRSSVNVCFIRTTNKLGRKSQWLQMNCVQ